MRKKIKIKSIIIDEKEILVETIYNKEGGVKFYLNDDLQYYFKDIPFSKNTYCLPILKIRTIKNEIWTLFNCFYTYRFFINGQPYIHLIYNMIVMSDVEEKNFQCNRLRVKLKNFASIPISNLLPNNLSFTYDNYRINTKIKFQYCNIIIKSKHFSNYDDLYTQFTYLFELLNFIYGYFFSIEKITFYCDKKKIVVETETVHKYISSKMYINKGLHFLKLDVNKNFKTIFINYINFRKIAHYQLDLFFESTMENNKYNELNVVKILQIFDGIFANLQQFSNDLNIYPKELNDDIINYIDNIDFNDLNEKYQVSININDKIKQCIYSMYKVNYREKIKHIFETNNEIIFEAEKNEKSGHLKFTELVNKSVNSRNMVSHADEKSKYLTSTESLVYIYKFVLTFRLLIFNAIGLSKYIDSDKLEKVIKRLDAFIEKNLNNQ